MNVSILSWHACGAYANTHAPTGWSRHDFDKPTIRDLANTHSLLPTTYDRDQTVEQYRRTIPATSMDSFPFRCLKIYVLAPQPADITHSPSLTGAWWSDTKERIVLEGNVDNLSITWRVNEQSRALDWSWGGHENTFTLSGGDQKIIVRWRPSVRHIRFDDDHIVWIPYNTKKKRIEDRGIIVYTRERRTLKYFQTVDPHDWCT